MFFFGDRISIERQNVFSSISILSVRQYLSCQSESQSVNILSCQSNSLICTLCILYPCKTLIEFSKRLCSHTKPHAFRLCLVILYIASYILICITTGYILHHILHIYIYIYILYHTLLYILHQIFWFLLSIILNYILSYIRSI